MTHTFRSLAHPGDQTLAAVYARAVVRPLAACMLPLMVVTLVDVLRGLPVTPYLTIGYPFALAVAAAFTAYRIRTTPAELIVWADRATMRTVWECVSAVTVPPAPVVDLRRTRRGFVVTIGYTTYEEHEADWRDTDDLLQALTVARRAPLTAV